MITRWKRYNIFISSTFKDMDIERDVIKFEVIPDLNRKFRPKGVELQAIDLRLGVNTEGMDEGESASKVLKVCAGGIDSSRPFFIGLVGSRYGWIPPVERWQEFLRGLPTEERAMMQETFGASVTELEMIYGALNEKSLAEGHILFYLRDEVSYEGMPEDKRGIFVDADPEMKSKLSSLKAKIESLVGKGGEDDRCSHYRLYYDRAKDSFDAGDFKDLLIRQISAQIELELSSEVAGRSVWEEEKAAVEARFSELLSKIVPFSYYDKTLTDVVLHSSEDGVGLSSELAWHYAQLSKDMDRICLCTIAGSSANSLTERSILALWCSELASVLGESCLGEEDICTVYQSLVKKASSQGKTVTLFVDDLQRLGGKHGAIADLLNRDQQAIVCCCGAEYESFIRYNSQLKVLGRSSKLCRDDVKLLIDRLQRDYFLELPSSIGVKELAGSSPLEICMLFHLMESLDSEDFRKIRGAGTNQIKAINDYLTGIWAELKRLEGTGGLFGWALDKMIGNLKLDRRWKECFAMIAASPIGLRQSDLEALFAEFWSESDFFRLCGLLPEFVYEDRARHIWICTADPGVEDMPKLMFKSAEYLSGLPKDDPMAVALLAYFIVLSGDPEFASLLVFEGEDFVKSATYYQYFKLPAERFLSAKRKEFLDYVRKLPQCLALHFCYGVQRILRNTSGNEDFAKDLADVLMCFDLNEMDAEQCLVIGGMLCGFPILETKEYMTRAIEALQRASLLGVKADLNGNVGVVYLLNKLCNLCRETKDKEGEKRYAEMLEEYSSAAAGEEKLREAGEKLKAGPDFMSTVFQQQMALQMKLKNELDGELSVGRGIKVLFGRKKARDEEKIMEIAGRMTAAADELYGGYEIDNNTFRMVYILYFAYNNAVSAYVLTGHNREAFESSFRLLMNMRSATYGGLDVKQALSLVLKAHVMLLSAACAPGVCSNEELILVICESTAAVVNRMSRIDPKDADLADFYHRFSEVPQINEYISIVKEQDLDIVDLGYKIEELGEVEGLHWELE